MAIPFRIALALVVLNGSIEIASAQDDSRISDTRQAPLVPYTDLMGDLPEVAFSQLSDQTISPQGRRALAINPQSWKHGETPHFILHFTENFVAKSVAMEAEAHFRYIAADLAITPADGRKSHIYIFENAGAWELFRDLTSLEEWTGAVTIGNELFVPRNPKYKFKGHALAHEIVHLTVHRFVGTKLPLWLEEGYAEDVGMSAYGNFYRRRGYSGRMPKPPLTSFIPLSRLTAFSAYPSGREVGVFYVEANWLTGFLNNFGNQQKFLKMFRVMAQGASFDAGLREGYGSRWLSLDDLENEFKKYLATASGGKP